MIQHPISRLYFRPIARLPLRCAALPLCIALAACSGDIVNMGENDADSSEPPPFSRCAGDRTLVGDVIVRTQAELDALEGCTTIDGHLVVEPFFQPDLRALHQLRVVRGELGFGGAWLAVPGSGERRGDQDMRAQELVESGFLPSLEGLERLEAVGGLSFVRVAVENLAPLAQLRQLTDSGMLYIDSNTISDLSPLAQLSGIQELWLLDDSLVSLDGLDIRDHLGSLFLRGAQLANIDALSSLRSVGEVNITGTTLRDVAPLAQLQTAGHLNISDNPSLETLLGLARIRSVQSLILSNNDALEDPKALPSLIRAEWLVVEGNDRLRQLPEISFVGVQVLRIMDNPMLEALPQLYNANEGNLRSPERASLVRAPGQIEIVRNAALQSLTLPISWSRADSVIIESNIGLRELDLMDLMTVNLLQLNDNPALDTVHLRALDTVDTLDVINNPLLAPATFDPVRTFERNMSGNADGAP